MKKLFGFLLFLTFFFLAARPVQAVATFRLEPASSTINVDDSQAVKIVLDTGGNSTGAVSVILSFDAGKLSAGSSLTPGIFSLVLVNTVDNANGRIRFDAGAPTNQSGSNITVATINFTGQATGTAAVSFTQARAVDADTNQYLTTDSSGGSYTIAAVGGGPTPTPTPTSAPTPTPTPTSGAGEATPTSTPTPTTGGNGNGGGEATPTPTPTPTQAAEELPEAGLVSPTLFLFLSGLLSLGLGGWAVLH